MYSDAVRDRLFISLCSKLSTEADIGVKRVNEAVENKITALIESKDEFASLRSDFNTVVNVKTDYAIMKLGKNTNWLKKEMRNLTN